VTSQVNEARNDNSFDFVRVDWLIGVTGMTVDYESASVGAYWSTKHVASQRIKHRQRHDVWFVLLSFDGKPFGLSKV